VKGLTLVTGLNEISAELHTVENYTRLLQAEQETLSANLTESRRRSLGLLQQCNLLPQAERRECESIKQEMTNTRLAIDYLQVNTYLVLSLTIIFSF